MSAPIRVAVLISGAGSNMAALIDAGRAPDAPFEVVLVVSNRPDAGGLAVAEAKGVPVVSVDHRLYGEREVHERAIDVALTDAGVRVVDIDDESIRRLGQWRRLRPHPQPGQRGRWHQLHHPP